MNSGTPSIVPPLYATQLLQSGTCRHTRLSKNRTCTRRKATVRGPINAHANPSKQARPAPAVVARPSKQTHTLANSSAAPPLHCNTEPSHCATAAAARVWALQLPQHFWCTLSDKVTGLVSKVTFWVLRRRDLRRGTQPQMSLKQFLSNIQSGTERFCTLSASLLHRLSKLSAALLRGSPFLLHGFHEFKAAGTNCRLFRVLLGQTD